ncbi:MAG: hypothetical protein Kow0099_26310 [Candidatus Abyssubacteria bacterium]
MNPGLSYTIENASYIAIAIICFYGAYLSYKRAENTPGAKLVFIGLVLYGAYAFLAFAVPGFDWSLLDAYTKLARPELSTVGYFVTVLLRLGLVLVIAGLFQMGRSLKA